MIEIDDVFLMLIVIVFSVMFIFFGDYDKNMFLVLVCWFLNEFRLMFLFFVNECILNVVLGKGNDNECSVRLVLSLLLMKIKSMMFMRCFFRIFNLMF